MSSIVHQSPLKIIANKAAADTNDTAAASRGRFAAFVSFRWQKPGPPPAQNVNSAVSPLLAAGHFSGKYAKLCTKCTNNCNICFIFGISILNTIYD